MGPVYVSWLQWQEKDWPGRTVVTNMPQLDVCRITSSDMDSIGILFGL